MLCKIEKTFPYSHDGVTALTARAGEHVDIPDALMRGLYEAGLISEPDPDFVEEAAEDEAEDNKADAAEVAEPDVVPDEDKEPPEPPKPPKTKAADKKK